MKIYKNKDFINAKKQNFFFFLNVIHGKSWGKKGRQQTNNNSVIVIKCITNPSGVIYHLSAADAREWMFGYRFYFENRDNNVQFFFLRQAAITSAW